MSAEQPGLGALVGGGLVLALLVVIVGVRLIGRIDPPPYKFVPTFHGDAP